MRKKSCHTLIEEFVKDSSLLSADKGYIALNKLCAYNIWLGHSRFVDIVK